MNQALAGPEDPCFYLERVLSVTWSTKQKAATGKRRSEPPATPGRGLLSCPSLRPEAPQLPIPAPRAQTFPGGRFLCPSAPLSILKTERGLETMLIMWFLKEKQMAWDT